MSSGPHDANAQGDLIEAVWCAAYDLRAAIERAKAGHRGYCASDDQLLRTINNAMNNCGFRLVKT